MIVLEILLLFTAGLLSGIVNAIAGGGTFLTFGAMTLAGLPPISANATSSIVQFPGYVTSALAYKDDILREWKAVAGLAAISFFGSLGGALLLTLAGVVLSAVRWSAVLDALGLHAPFKRLLSLYFAGQFMGNVLPSTIGGGSARPELRDV